ncbi:unnamed protein product [Fusarium graminearum]|nr:unnamed protein product [Fusarium graminearum]
MEPPPRTTDGPPNRQGGSKRLKIDVACDHCRIKKVKCDGVRPVCGSCNRKLALRDSCNYTASSITQNQCRVPLAQKHNRDKTSPCVQDSQRNGVYSPGIMGTQQPRHPSNQPQPHHSSPSTSTPGSRRPDSHGQGKIGASLPSVSPSAVDSMTAVADDGASTEEFFGKSSAGSFTAQIKKAIDLRLGRPTTDSQGNSSSVPRSFSGISSTTSASSSTLSYVLPPRRQADHLMELYWFYVDPLYPFLDRTRWNRVYNAIFAGTAMDLDERIFMATLNVILALSTQLFESQSPDQREQSSETFFHRAQELLPMNPWEPGSLELVQCLLVTSQYLQSTNNPHQTWMVIGSAIRMAQGLGFHLPETSSSRSDPGERELLRRIWYGCVLMDRMVSVTHGRPAMISRYLAKSVPLPTESTTNEQSAIQNAEYYSFFVQSVRLYEIIHKTMMAFYSHIQENRYKEKETYSDPECSDGEDDDLDRVVQLDRCISRWESRLPKHLRWDLLESNTDKIAQRQAVILRMRFCLSPFPSERPQAEDNLQARVIQQSAMFCVTTAQNMINTLVAHRSMDSTVGLLPAWWYRVYYVYSAATVLIAAKLRPDVFSAVEIGQSWGQAISLLKTHEQFGQSAKRCVTALHILSSKILQANSRGSLGREVASNNNGILYPDTRDDQMPPHMIPDMESLDRMQQLAQGFESPVPDFNPRDFADFDFNVNDMSWLNDIQGVWELLNE